MQQYRQRRARQSHARNFDVVEFTIAGVRSGNEGHSTILALPTSCVQVCVAKFRAGWCSANRQDFGGSTFVLSSDQEQNGTALPSRAEPSWVAMLAGLKARPLEVVDQVHWSGARNASSNLKSLFCKCFQRLSPDRHGILN